MRRREFLGVLLGTATWLPAVRAQQAGNVPTIGLLGTATPRTWGSWIAAFVERLGELGWVDGRTIAIEYRWAEGRPERYAEFAIEFVRLKVDVIVTTVPAVAVQPGRQSGATRQQRHGTFDPGA
jgi:putative tryptophan/tyrosine transport system substrate-binding protein